LGSSTKIGQPIPVLVKIGLQKLTLDMTTFVCFPAYLTLYLLPLKRWYLSTELHHVTSKKVAVITKYLSEW